MGWTLVVDFGTTSTTAALVDGGAVTPLDLDGGPHMPSAVRRTDDGDLVAGVGADRSGWAPETIDRNPKCSVGIGHLVLGGKRVEVADAVAAVLRAVLTEGTRKRGVPPTGAVLTHPARWIERQRAALVDAAARAGLPDPELVAEPVAAARHHQDVAAGALVAVYDLGGTFETAVLRRTAPGFELVAVGGRADLGGEHLDDLLVAHVGRQVRRAAPDVWAKLQAGETETWRRRAVELRREIRAAKESLSRNKRHIVHVSAAACDVPITRVEWEGLIRESIAATVDELMATVARTGVSPAMIARYCLAGGGTRIPLVARLVAEATGATPVTADDPMRVVVLGAARVVVAPEPDGRVVPAATTGPIPVAPTPPTEPTASAGSAATPAAPTAPTPVGAEAVAQAVTQPAAPVATVVPPPTPRATPRWRRRAVLLPVVAAAAAVVVAAAMVQLRDAPPGRVVDAVSATAATPTPSQATGTVSATTEATPSPDLIALTINGPSLVPVGQTAHYTASYTHPELVTSCRWTDELGNVVQGCGWLPVSFTSASGYTVRFTVQDTTGATYTATKTITAAG